MVVAFCDDLCWLPSRFRFGTLDLLDTLYEDGLETACVKPVVGTVMRFSGCCKSLVYLSIIHRNSSLLDHVSHDSGLILSRLPLLVVLAKCKQRAVQLQMSTSKACMHMHCTRSVGNSVTTVMKFSGIYSAAYCLNHIQLDLPDSLRLSMGVTMDRIHRLADLYMSGIHYSGSV